MKQRLLVMNGQRIVQAEQAGAWITQKVDKAGVLRPGIYNLYTAQEADKAQRHDGVIAYVDSAHIYQQVGKNFVMHSRENFDIVPDVGSTKRITYDAVGKAQVSVEAIKRSRGRSR